MLGPVVSQSNLLSAIWPNTRQTDVWRALIVAVAGSLLMTLAAKTQIPFYPVPLSMQTYVVLILGMALGPRLGGAAIGLYLMQGAFGMPVFANSPERGIGLAYMAGPTGGYLLGFFIAAIVVGWLAERGYDRTFVKTAVVAMVGMSLIYIPGLLWLGTLIGWDKPVLELGLYPFVLGDLVKLGLATFTLPLAWKLIGRRAS